MQKKKKLLDVVRDNTALKKSESRKRGRGL